MERLVLDRLIFPVVVLNSLIDETNIPLSDMNDYNALCGGEWSRCYKIKM